MESPLTAWEKADLVLGLVSIASTGISSAIKGSFRGEGAPASYKHHLVNQITRKFLTRFSLRQHRFLETPFEEVYTGWCRTNNLTPDLVTTSSGLRGFWVGNRSAKHVVVNYHGGGFVMDGSPPYLTFWSSILHNLARGGVEIAFFFPCYRLSPEHPHPAQYQDAVEALRYVLEDAKRSPSDIILAGDSSGGNLALAVLSHVSSHELPSCPSLTLEEPLNALVLISPAVSFDLGWPSVERNAKRDYLIPELIACWNQTWLAGASQATAFEPCGHDSSWWEDIKVKQTLVVAASDELEVDSIAAWVDKFQVHNPDTTFIIAKNEVHDAMFVWPMFGLNKETEQGQTIKHWLGGRLGTWVVSKL